MKIAIWTLIFLAACYPVFQFLYQRWRQKQADKNGLALYATVRGAEPVKFFGKPQPIMKITMWVQEPGQEAREVEMRSRVPEGQRIEPGMKLGVVIDPRNPKRVYPAGPDAAKRMTLTGSRAERRQMKKRRM